RVYGRHRTGPVVAARGVAGHVPVVIGLVPGRQHEEDAALVRGPVVLEEVPLDQHALGVLHLHEVHDQPRGAGVARILPAPREELLKGVQAHLDVRGDQTRNGRPRAATHQVLTRRLQAVVDQLEDTRPTPTHYG